MNEYIAADSGCQGCVFYQKGCVLGRHRAWNAARCDDFRPFCLVCDYPDFFCNTCKNSSFKRFRPGDMTMMRMDERIDMSRYSCVWNPAAR